MNICMYIHIAVTKNIDTSCIEKAPGAVAVGPDDRKALSMMLRVLYISSSFKESGTTKPPC